MRELPLLDLHQDREPRVKALLLGHIRLGTFGEKAPQASEGWVFTSSDPVRLRPLAEDFGGEVEQYTPQGAGNETWRVVSHSDALTAVLPFADLEGNLAQDWVLWQRSGLKRRCDGVTCSVISLDEETGEITEEQAECICRTKERRECAAETRLRLLLPQTGLGLWELVTHSRIAAEHLYDQLRFIASIAPDRMNHLPVRVVYAPREISYFDEKQGKRRTTTKRVVSVSIAGDAQHALAALALEPDRALIQAVSAALADAGRDLVLPSAPSAPRALGAAPETFVAEHGEAAAEEPAQVEGPRAGTEVDGEGEDHGLEAPSPEADGPATPEQWKRATTHIGKSATVLRRARQRFPEAGLKASTDITRAQMQALIEEALS